VFLHVEAPTFSGQSAQSWRSFTPQEESWYSFLLEATSTPGSYCGWKNKSIEKLIDLIGNRTRDLPACSIVSQPTTLQRAPLTKQGQVKRDVRVRRKL
jgi:hypothetical protein